MCHYCDKPAIAYCDHVERTSCGIDTQTGKLTMQADLCDRAICGDHRRRVGHVCDRSRRTTNNLSDTIDHCTIHED